MTPDPELIPLLEKARPLLNRLQDLIHVEKEAVELENGYGVLIRFFFTPDNAPGQPAHLTVLTDPDGAYEYGLLTDDEFSKIPTKEQA